MVPSPAKVSSRSSRKCLVLCVDDHRQGLHKLDGMPEEPQTDPAAAGRDHVVSGGL